jgi:hypothetical protein
MGLGLEVVVALDVELGNAAGTVPVSVAGVTGVQLGRVSGVLDGVGEAVADGVTVGGYTEV